MAKLYVEVILPNVNDRREETQSFCFLREPLDLTTMGKIFS